MVSRLQRSMALQALAMGFLADQARAATQGIELVRVAMDELAVAQTTPVPSHTAGVSKYKPLECANTRPEQRRARQLAKIAARKAGA